MTSAAAEPTAEAFLAARATIKPFLHRTPMFGSKSLSAMTGVALYLKAESLQKTGSFKPRGALTALSRLTPSERERGVITMSAGNHGQGLAFAAAQFGCRCTVVIRDDATGSKVDAMRAYGAEVVFTPVPLWRQRLDEERERRGQVFIHPFADPGVVTGQGTLGLEILEEVPDAEAILVPVGGGGLISGVAAAIKQQRPRVRLIGVEPEGAAVVSHSLQQGSPQKLDRMDTIADGLAAPWTEEFNLQLIRRYVDDVVLVSDRELAQSLVMILERTKLLVEPAGAAGLAALLAGKVERRAGAVVALLTGGNADAGKLIQVFRLHGPDVTAVQPPDAGQSSARLSSPSGPA